MRSCMFVVILAAAAACQEEIANGPAPEPVYVVLDADGDGYPAVYDDHDQNYTGYLEEAEVSAILESEGWSGKPDCNDDNPDVYPGAPESGLSCGENPA